MPPSPQVSVIIPAYNARKTIGLTFDAVLKQSFSDFEVIVVDDGSTDDTALIVKAFSPGVRYFYQTNAGPAAARNFGAHQAKGRLLFFTDSDCEPDPGWIEKAVDTFDAKPEVAVVAGSYGIANREFILARCIQKEISYRHKRMPSFPKAFGSYNFSVRKEIFLSVGGFNAAYLKASGEDNDLSYKIYQAGHKIYFEKASLVFHHHTADWMKYLREQLRHGFWRAKMYYQFPSMIKGDDYTFWKDMVEVPLCVLSVVLFSLFIMRKGAAGFFLLVNIMVLFVIQLWSSWCITKNFYETFFYSFITFLRSFARTIGFSSGILCFSKNLDKKT